MNDRELELLAFFKSKSIEDLLIPLIETCIENNLSSGTLMNLQSNKTKYDYIYNLYKILDSCNAVNNINFNHIIDAYSKDVEFKFDKTNDPKILKNIFYNFQKYDILFEIEKGVRQ